MVRSLLMGSIMLLGALTAVAHASDPPECATVHLSDIGWSDVTATTATTSEVLKGLGYQTQITLLSLPVTYASMKSGQIDVFLGNWMPSQRADREPYVRDGSIEVMRANLVDAKYTLAVPDYLYAQGLHSFADIGRFGDPLERRIYGVEPGNDGNRHALEMIHANLFGLKDFQLVESSESGMLSEVQRRVEQHRAVLFLAWEPHPMNERFKLRYLDGGDSVFGANYGSASVFTNVRKGYQRQCPNVARLLGNLTFSLPMETWMMERNTAGNQTPQDSAKAWLASHPEQLQQWLNGVTTLDGRPGLPAAEAALGAKIKTGYAWFDLQAWISTHKLPVGRAMSNVVDMFKRAGIFNLIGRIGDTVVGTITHGLERIPPILFAVLVGALGYGLRRSFTLFAGLIVGLLFIDNQGFWTETMETVSLVLVAALTSMCIGVPLGVAASHRSWLAAVLRPLLDLMQTLPSFVYLIPTLVLFGLGVVPGLISTVIFALPAPIRLTQLGFANVPRELREAGEAFGASSRQLLWKVELPCALPSILAGLTQCIMLSLSMVVVAALVGAGGLGVPVVRALNTVRVDMGFEAGLCIVVLAIILDRLCPGQTKGGR